VLSEKLSQWTAGKDKRLWAVGYYQHQTDGELTLRDDEAALFASEFPPPGKVILLTALNAAGQPVGGFFPREAGEIQRNTPLPFPLSRMELRGAAERSPAPPLPLPLEPVEPPTARRRLTQYDAIRWTSIGIVVVALAMIAIGEYRWRPQMRGERPAEDVDPSASDLGLAIDGSPERVVVRWNRSAPAIANSVEGTLSVTDGTATQILLLKRADLAAGSLLYFPHGNHVLFQLQVTTRDGRKAIASAAFLSAPRPGGGRP